MRRFCGGPARHEREAYRSKTAALRTRGAKTEVACGEAHYSFGVYAVSFKMTAMLQCGQEIFCPMAWGGNSM